MDTGDENAYNWLEMQKIFDKRVENLIRSVTSVAILDSMHVEEQYRGQGHGNDLLENFINEAASFGAELIILTADAHQEQGEDFDLIKWYEGYGFKTILKTSSGPLMVLDLR